MALLDICRQLEQTVRQGGRLSGLTLQVNVLWVYLALQHVTMHEASAECYVHAAVPGTSQQRTDLRYHDVTTTCGNVIDTF